MFNSDEMHIWLIESIMIKICFQNITFHNVGGDAVQMI